MNQTITESAARFERIDELMSTISLVLTIIQVLLALVLTCVVLLQTGKSEGLSALGASSDTFMARNKSKTRDAIMARWTKYVAIGFMVLTLILCLV